MVKLPTLRKYIKDNYGETTLTELTEILDDNLTCSKVDLKEYTWKLVYKLDQKFKNNSNRWSIMISSWYDNIITTIENLKPSKVSWIS